jgi:hypothetical protein
MCFGTKRKDPICYMYISLASRDIRKHAPKARAAAVFAAAQWPHDLKTANPWCHDITAAKSQFGAAYTTCLGVAVRGIEASIHLVSHIGIPNNFRALSTPFGKDSNSTRPAIDSRPMLSSCKPHFHQTGFSVRVKRGGVGRSGLLRFRCSEGSYLTLQGNL